MTVTEAVGGDEVSNDIRAIAQVGTQAAGSVQARKAHDRLAQQGVEILPQLLVAMDSTNIVAANWYRSVYERIVENAVAQSDVELPFTMLKDYVRDPTRQGRVRRLVFTLVNEYIPDYQKSVMPTFLDDPEFRNDAVNYILEAGDRAESTGNQKLAKQKFESAFVHARESNQVTKAAGRLEALGVTVDVIGHLGLITRWYLLGPFDAPGTSGFEKSFPPEKEVKLEAKYVGQDGTEIGWKLFETDHSMGFLNLIQAIAPVKEAVGYAYTEIRSPSNQKVQLRCGADDNLTVWLNDERILSRDQWLNGTRYDRFTAPAFLKEGINRVLVKVCQGPQHVNPSVPNNWSMQLRFCDKTGANVGASCLLPQPEVE